MNTQKKNKTSTAPLKVASLILGTCFWLILSNALPTTRSITVPICFHSVSRNHMPENAPESVTVTLRGRKKVVRSLDATTLALHIDASTLKPGKHLITANNENLLLPHSIAVIEQTPARLCVDIPSCA